MSDIVQTMPEGPFEATPKTELERKFMDPNTPKMEREWWAASEITALRLKQTVDVCTICPACNGQTWRAVKNPRLGPGVYEVRCDCCNGFGWIDEEHGSRP